MILTREERERFVLDLYNQGKSTREIAEEARMSFRDIGAILDKAEEEKETNKEQAEKMSQSTQAYKLYSEGKSPIQVAIALNLQDPEVARFYVEYWKLRQLYSLNKSHVTVEFFSFFLTNSNLIISQSISIKEIGFFSQLKVFLIPRYRASGIHKSPKIPNSFKKEKEYTLS